MPVSEPDSVDRQMLAVAEQVADFAYKKGVGEAIAVDRLVQEYRRVSAEVERLREEYGRVDRALTQRNIENARLYAALDGLCERQHDYPTDLSRDAEWANAFQRARDLLNAS